jgi:hypothetical protein
VLALLQDTAPTPLSMLQLVAFVIPLHDSVDDWPLVIVVGLAVNVPILGPAALTVTVADFVALPPDPVAVNV